MKTNNCKAFTDFLVNQTLSYDQEIIADMRPQDCWIATVTNAEFDRPDWAFEWMTSATAKAVQDFGGEWNRQCGDKRFPRHTPYGLSRVWDRFNAIYPDLKQDWNPVEGDEKIIDFPCDP